MAARAPSQIEMAIFNEEVARLRAPAPLNVLGLTMAAPTIITYGTDEQKKRYLSKILSCEEIWCQGFSEPNSGSDLAAARTRAELQGDEFIVNGQKVWTTLGHIADWCMLVVRTDPDAPKHRGLSYLLVDMKSPGITVRPLRQMTGESEFNEMFFEDVHVPRQNLLGALNEGWRVATTTLMNERGTTALASVMRYRIVFEEILDLARSMQRNGASATSDPMVRQRLAAVLRRTRNAALHLIPRLLADSPRRQSRTRGLHLQARVVGAESADAGICDRTRRACQSVGQGLPSRGARRPLATSLPALARQYYRGWHLRNSAQYHRRTRPRIAPCALSTRSPSEDLTALRRDPFPPPRPPRHPCRSLCRSPSGISTS